MSDSLATQDTLVAPSPEQAQAASEQAQRSSDRQPSPEQAAPESENIKKLQASLTKRINEERQARIEKEQQLQMYQQQFNQLQQRLAQVEDSAAPDDYARLELQLQRAQQRAQQAEYALQVEAQRRADAEAYARARDSAAERYGVEPEDIDRAKPKDYTDIIEAAIAARDKRKQQQQERDEQRAIDNRPDLGGGRASTATTRWELEYEEARKNKDSPRMAMLLRTQGK